MSRSKHSEKVMAGVFVLILGVGAIGLAGTGLWYYQSNIALAYRGPTKISAAQLGKVTHPRELPSTWVSFTFDNGIDTKYDVVVTKGPTKHVERKFWLIQAGDKWVIASVPPNFSGNKVAGELKRVEHSLETDIRNQITQKFADVHHGQLLGWEFYADIDYGENWIAFMWCMIGLGGGGLVFVILGISIFYCKPAPEPQASPRANLAQELPNRLTTAKLFERAVPPDNNQWRR